MNKHKKIIVYLLLFASLVALCGCTIKETVIEPYGLSVTVPGSWEIDGAVEVVPGVSLEQAYKAGSGNELVYTQYYDEDAAKTLGSLKTDLEDQGYTVKLYARNFYVVGAWQQIADKYLAIVAIENAAQDELYTVILTLDAAGIDDIEKYIHDVAYSAEIK